MIAEVIFSLNTKRIISAINRAARFSGSLNYPKPICFDKVYYSGKDISLFRNMIQTRLQKSEKRARPQPSRAPPSALIRKYALMILAVIGRRRDPTS